MGFWQEFSFDIISFSAGFILATLLYWLQFRIRKMWPALSQYIQLQHRRFQQKTFVNIDTILRQDVILRAQKNHLSNQLFSLDEILIQPRLLIPSELIEIEDTTSIRTQTAQHIPYFPEWPEIASQYTYPTITPIQAIQKNANLVVFGQLGAGKTIALAQLACSLARKDDSAGQKIDCFPFYLHVNEFSPKISADDDLLSHLVSSTLSWYPSIIQNRIPAYYKDLEQSGNLILILDGLDELPETESSQYINFLKILKQTHSRVQIIVACSTFNLNGLTQMGFIPLALAAWSQHDRTSFIENWGSIWASSTNQGIRDIGKNVDFDIDLMKNLLDTNNLSLTPLEWTLHLWALYSGDLLGSSTLDTFEAYIKRIAGDIVGSLVLQEIAFDFIKIQCTSILRSSIEAYFVNNISHKEKGKGQKQHGSDYSNSRHNSKQTNPSRLTVDSLISLGFFIQNRSGLISFSHPCIVGFLASQFPQEQGPPFTDTPHGVLVWAVEDSYFHYLAANGRTNNLDHQLFTSQPPLFSDLLRFARWIKDIPSNQPWRAQVLRQLVQLIHREDLPFNLRAAFTAAAIYSNDPGITILLRQLLHSTSPKIRELAAMGCGAAQVNQSINDLVDLLSDDFIEVKVIAALAIGIISSPSTRKIKNELLTCGNEDISQAMAECLSSDERNGFEFLVSGTESDQILVRRASVIGLGLIHEEWSRLIIERLATQDAQWVVRNIACQILENAKNQNALIPVQLPIDRESPWLIAFAGKLGKGIPGGKPATDILIQVFQSGTQEQKFSALRYLRAIPDNEVIQAISDVVKSIDDETNQAALNTLWYYSRCGIPVK